MATAFQRPGLEPGSSPIQGSLINESQMLQLINNVILSIITPSEGLWF